MPSPWPRPQPEIPCGGHGAKGGETRSARWFDRSLRTFLSATRGRARGKTCTLNTLDGERAESALTSVVPRGDRSKRLVSWHQARTTRAAARSPDRDCGRWLGASCGGKCAKYANVAAHPNDPHPNPHPEGARPCAQEEGLVAATRGAPGACLPLAERWLEGRRPPQPRGGLPTTRCGRPSFPGIRSRLPIPSES